MRNDPDCFDPAVPKFPKSTLKDTPLGTRTVLIDQDQEADDQKRWGGS